MGWKEDELFTAAKNIRDAQSGLFGNAGAAVIAKNEQVIKNLTSGGSPVYVGTGSSAAKAIEQAAASNPLRAGSTYSTNAYRTSQYNTESSSGDTLRCTIIDDGGESIVIIKPDGSQIRVSRTRLSMYVDSSGNWIYKPSMLVNMLDDVAGAAVETVSGGGGKKGLLYAAIGLLGIFLLRR